MEQNTIILNEIPVTSNVSLRSEILTLILMSYPDMTLNTLKGLINACSPNGCKFVAIKNYSSDSSNNTEIANHVVNIGISYANLKECDNNTLSTLTPGATMGAIVKHDFSVYDLSKFAYPETPHMEILFHMENALNEMRNPKETAPKADNNIKITNTLWFNTATKNLLIFGSDIAKNVIEKAETKKITSAPLTVAKNIIDRKSVV